MFNISSLLDKIFIQIISNPIITAPKRQRTATGSTFKSKVGLININPPKNDIIDANEKPSVAVRKGKNSSMSMAIQLVKSGKADALVSAGNTGALMAMTKLILRLLSMNK